jgi:hypothetical protein
MKTRIVLVSVAAGLIALSASAQRVENDDMYFTAKDREKSKAAEAEASLSTYSTKSNKNKKFDEVAVQEDNTNPTDSYSARNVNPEYISRTNSEVASEDESDYYDEDYASSSDDRFNYSNSYNNNINWARSSWYANNFYSPYYGGGYGMMNPYYDPWMMSSPYYGGYRSGWSLSLSYGFGNYYSPFGYGFGGGYGWGNPYSYYGYNSYYGGGYGYPTYYYGNEGSGRTYGKRPSRHSAVVTPSRSTAMRSNTASQINRNTNSVTTRSRQTQDEYYVRPSRRTYPTNSGRSTFSTPSSERSDRYIRPSNPDNNSGRTREFTPEPRESRTPSYAPSSSPSRSSGGSSGSGGGSSPRPRGRN